MNPVQQDFRHFAQLIGALEPWLTDLVIIGGWASRLYRFHPMALQLAYPPLFTLDTDIALPARLPSKAANIRARLLESGFQEELLGDHRPPVAHYRLGGETSGFYAEFLTPLIGGPGKRSGKADLTMRIGGVTSQKLRHLDLLLRSPWSVTLDQSQGFPVSQSLRTFALPIPPATWLTNYWSIRSGLRTIVRKIFCTSMTPLRCLEVLLKGCAMNGRAL